MLLPRPLGGASRLLAAVAGALLGPASIEAAAQGPTIDIWYGAQQSFGVPGHAQGAVNVLGRVSDPDGVASLGYRLNGGVERPLSIGPDERRLQAAGDFNIDIPRQLLVDGANAVEILATDTLQNTSQTTVTLQYQAAGSWPRTWATAWQTLAQITDGAQIGDGLWHIDATGARPTELGYDRTLLIGDEFGWRDYEVLVPITLHSFDPAGFLGTAVAPAFGITNRWIGHFERIAGEQPLSGWTLQGGGPWYEVGQTGGARLSLQGFHGMQIDRQQVIPLGVEHWWKVRSETLPNGDTFYGFKYWPAGSPEPGGWFASGTESPDDLQRGSLIFIAHYADVSIGDVQVTAIQDELLPPTLSGLSWLPGDTRARATWNSDEPTRFELAYGLTPSLELGVLRCSDLLVRHAGVLCDLTPSTTYHYELRAWDGRDQAAVPLSGTFTTATNAPPQPTGLVSDDFSGSQLDESRWIFVDPLNDAHACVNGHQLEIEVPAGQAHGGWYDTGGNRMPRVVQAVANADFEIEAKFDSPIDALMKAQGIVVEQDANNYLRFDFLSSSLGTRIWIGGVKDGFRPLLFEQHLLTLNTPMWMRVWREGHTWTVWHSFDGELWTNDVVFDHAMTVTRIGVAAGNSQGTPHVAEVDYFAVTLDPVEPEDGQRSKLVTRVHGAGTITRDPDLLRYAESTAVELTATPEPGWLFEGWVGDFEGLSNPLQITTSSEPSLAIAVFSQGPDLTPPRISQIQVQQEADRATVSWRTDEPSTGIVLYGLSPAYTAASEDERLLLQHVAVLEGLEPGRLYHFQIRCEDGSRNEASTADRTLRTSPAGNPFAIDSDDFSGATLDPSQWNFVDPNGDSDVEFDAQRLAISVPATSTHDAWSQTNGNQLARAMQAAPDADFEIEARFESDVALDSQAQGLLFEQDLDDYMKIETLRFAGAKRLFVGVVRGGANTTIHAFFPVNLPMPVHLRVRRLGNQWTVSTSPDGSSWTAQVAFLQPLPITAVGVYAGNRFGTPHRMLCDFFFDTAQPITPEDGNPSALVVNALGKGHVLRSPELARYTNGQNVSLEAVPQLGWYFSHWSGDASGSANPLAVIAGTQARVTAHFLRDTTPPVISGVQAVPRSRRATVIWTTNEPASGRLEWGRTPAYGQVVESTVLRTSHVATIADLSPGEQIFYRVRSADAANNEAFSPGQTFRTRAGLISDDFASACLTRTGWRLEDPSESSTALLVNRRLELSLPGASTEPSPGPARLVQQLEDGDFCLETRIESGFSASRGQSVGLLVESDRANGVSFGATWATDHLRFTWERREGGTTTRGDLPLLGQPLQLPIYLRIEREGDQWRLEHSFNRLVWIRDTSFTQRLTDLVGGAFAENRASIAFTGQFDYVFETSEPIVPEDGATSALVLNVIGPGEIVRTPDLPRYAPGQTVRLEARPFSGGTFAGWEGGVTSTTNPLNVIVGTSSSITARFDRE